MVNLGEVYEGIDLKLRAYGDNVEKLFYVKPGANPEQIKISLSGIQSPENPLPLSTSVRGTGGCPPLAGVGGGAAGGDGVVFLGDEKETNEDVAPTFMVGSRPGGGLWVNEHGELVAETELGPVKFTKPVAYQEIDGKRVEIECGYVIAGCGMQDAECKTNQKPEAGGGKQETRGKRQISSREKGMGRKGAYSTSNSQLSTKNLQPETQNPQHTSGKASLATRHSSLVYSFTVASYDKSHDLIIDPLLASTFLGGSSNYDDGFSLALDASGNVYVTGYTESSNFPTTSGAYNTSYNGGVDVFVSKLNSGLSSLLASTFLGGSGLDIGYSLALDTSGNVYVTGWTLSTDFPTTSGAYDTSQNVSYDVFVSKLNGGLTSLLASTYLGGSDADYAKSLVVDSNGNLYVIGYTQSSDFPTTTGAYDTSSNNYDMFISKLSGDLTSLYASTYLGPFGSAGYTGTSMAMAIDSVGNIYVTGITTSSDFPTTVDAYDTSANDTNYGDGFVSKLNNNLTNLLASTYLGGSGYDTCTSITLDSSGNIYVTGETWSSDFPTTTGVYDNTYNGSYGDWNIFVSKLNGDLTNLVASTFLGISSYGAYVRYISAVVSIDSSGSVYIAGHTQASDFPTTTGAYDNSHNGNYDDVFIAKLNDSLSSLFASTFLGGSSSGGEYPQSIAIDSNGNIYVAGITHSSDFPTTTGSYDTSYNGGGDVFVSKLDGNLSATTTTPTPTPTPASTPYSNVSDGFDYPVGYYGLYGLCLDSKGDSSCYWLCQDFLKNVDDNCDVNGLTTHLGEDWNRGSGYDDYGDTVYAVSIGEVVYAESTNGWGNVIIIRHNLPDGTQVESLYGHLKDMYVTSGSVVSRGQEIGTLGDGDGTTASHLHFEIRYSNCPKWGLPGQGYNADSTGWTDPSDFIESHRTLSATSTSFIVIVTDADTGSAISGASVTWGSYSTTTDSIGYGNFDSVPCQAATLKVNKPGYLTFTESYTPACDSSSTENVTLTPTNSNLPFGLTIITHGFQLDGAFPNWVDEMAVAIANRFGGTSTIPIYKMTITYEISTQDYIVSFEKDDSVPEDLSFIDAGGAIIKIDWSSLSGFTGKSTEKIGDLIFKKLGNIWWEVPIHLIGHSRGVSVNSRLAYKLGENGIWVDHFTCLDPQPLTTFKDDWKVEVYNNVLFADNNYRRWDGGVPLGEPVNFTYQRDLTGKVTGDAYRCDKTACTVEDDGTAHEMVHTYYHGTIDTKAYCVDNKTVQSN